MSKININDLKQSQKELCDSFVTDIETMDKIMAQYTHWNKKLAENGFRQYTLRNLILANGQHYSKTGDCIELLAPYRRWQKVDRQVRKGEKALWILAPIQKKIKEPKTPDEEPEYVTWFKKVPVFDLSQTDGEQLFDDWTEGKPKYSWETIKSRSGLEVVMTNKTYEEGKTDGNKVWISKNYADERKICILLHELAHTKLHFGDDREELSTPIKELEAESVAYMTARAIGIDNKQSASYIKSYMQDNPADEIKGRGSKLINCAVEILNQLGMVENHS